MCLTCGCMDAHKEMGQSNLTYDDLKRAADENGRTLSETVDIVLTTIDKDRLEHDTEYSAAPGG